MQNEVIELVTWTETQKCSTSEWFALGRSAATGRLSLATDGLVPPGCIGGLV